MDERQQSEFNMAVSYLARLNTLFYFADDAAMKLDAYTWFHTLMTLFRELSTEMTKKGEIEKYKETIQNIKPLIVQWVKDKTIGKDEMNNELYEGLHNFEMDLRGVLKSAGLQQRMSDDPSKALR